MLSKNSFGLRRSPTKVSYHSPFDMILAAAFTNLRTGAPEIFFIHGKSLCAMDNMRCLLQSEFSKREGNGAAGGTNGRWHSPNQSHQ
jgi:hypothetical protein